MKLSSIICLAIFTFTHAAFAEEEPIIIEKASTAVMQDSSEHLRLNKKWVAQWQLFGAGPNGSTQSAAIVGYHLDRNSVVQAEFGGGGYSQSGGLFANHKFNLSGNSYGVHYKKFFSNSFYVKAGVDYRSIDYSYTYGFSGYTESFQGDSFAAGLVIGNEWQWDNFNLGCDWVGMSMPFSSNVVSQNYASNDSFYQKELKDAQQRYLKDTFTQGLRFYIGYTF